MIDCLLEIKIFQHLTMTRCYFFHQRKNSLQIWRTLETERYLLRKSSPSIKSCESQVPVYALEDWSIQTTSFCILSSRYQKDWWISQNVSIWILLIQILNSKELFCLLQEYSLVLELETVNLVLQSKTLTYLSYLFSIFQI
jgi:hypothetical protein